MRKRERGVEQEKCCMEHTLYLRTTVHDTHNVVLGYTRLGMRITILTLWYVAQYT